MLHRLRHAARTNSFNRALDDPLPGSTVAPDVRFALRKPPGQREWAAGARKDVA